MLESKLLLYTCASKFECVLCVRECDGVDHLSALLGHLLLQVEFRATADAGDDGFVLSLVAVMVTMQTMVVVAMVIIVIALVTVLMIGCHRFVVDLCFGSGADGGDRDTMLGLEGWRRRWCKEVCVHACGTLGIRVRSIYVCLCIMCACVAYHVSMYNERC